MMESIKVMKEIIAILLGRDQKLWNSFLGDFFEMPPSRFLKKAKFPPKTKIPSVTSERSSKSAINMKL